VLSAEVGIIVSVHLHVCPSITITSW